MRKCGICGKSGHNARTCKHKRGQEEIPARHQILFDSQKKKNRRDLEINGIVPKRGLWLINRNKRKIAGKVKFVRKSGIIVWEDGGGMLVDSTHDTIVSSGYEFSYNKPVDEGWKIIGKEVEKIRR